jgi:hypothetical protein
VKGAGKSSAFYFGARARATRSNLSGRSAWAALLLVLLLVPALPLRAQDAALPSPTPTELLSPPDDPDQDHCFLPDPNQGIKLTWQPETGPQLSTYIEIRHYDPDREAWDPWLKKYANPPFTLLVHANTYDSVFAWRVWAVDRSGRSTPYARPSEWRLFCTEPKPQR